jgi:transposase
VEFDDAEENATPLEVRTAQRCAPTQEGFIRFQAIKLLDLGYQKHEVAEISGRTLRTINRWIALYQARGIDGLALKGRSGRPRKISKERFGAEIVPLVLDPAQVGETHFTGIKLHGYLVKELQVQLCYRTVLNYLHEHDLTRLVPRPWPERQDPAARAQYLEEIEALKQDERVELWFGDETGIEGDPRPRKVWVKKGSRPTSPYLGDHIRLNVIGAVSPKTGKLFSLVVPHVDTDVFQVFLNQLAEHTKHSQKEVLLVLDNASWHKSSGLNWHHIRPKYLPAYSPDFNPIEILWLCLKRDFFTAWFAKSPEQLMERILLALRSFIDNRNAVTSITDH